MMMSKKDENRDWDARIAICEEKRRILNRELINVGKELKRLNTGKAYLNYGVKWGLVAIAMGEKWKGRRFQITRILRVFGSKKPWLKGALFNKDGTLSKRVFSFCDDWELEEDNAEQKST